MKETQSAGGLFLRDGKILIVNQYGQSWSLPKGHLEEGEDVMEALKREIYEETGITDYTVVKPLGSYTRPSMGKNNEDSEEEMKTVHMFQLETDQQEIQPVDPNNPEARWVDKDEVVNYLTHPIDKDFFSHIIEEL
jgi:8-oxo-dGTP pyrophosphatase MutT (NUDIX family)